MKLIIFFVCIYAIFASETSFVDKYQSIFSNRRSIMTVMTQVESKIKNGGPMDSITKLLDEYVDENQREQADHDSLWVAQNEECNSEFEFRQGEVDDGKAALFEAQETLDKCVSQKTRSEQDLQSSNSQLSTVRFQISNGIVLKRNVDYSIETFQGATKIVLEATKQCHVFLDELVGTTPQASLLQLTKHINKMVPKVSQMKSLQHMTSLLSALAQVNMSAKQSNLQLDTAIIDKIRDILNKFEQHVRDQIVQVNAWNAKFNESYEEAMEHFNKEQERLIQLISDLKFELQQLKSCISIQTSDISSAEGKISRNQSLFDKATRMCVAQEKQYHEQTESRKDELVLIQAIKEKVIERFAEVSSGVTSRGELTNKQINESYKNESAYVKKDFVASK